ncbi:hypothetical protein [Paenibacillus contaminans]|uniref:hypothetical protein n=1 Tax=Paenibacillus contaminans TaxID=450362 RepID=UPI001EDD982D|nr:hypothetical protein [Paenibacillus contaminans]
MSPIRIDHPENHGLPAVALSRFFDMIEKNNLLVNSFMLLQEGRITARMWRAPYRPESLFV